MCLWIILIYFYIEKELEIERFELVNFFYCRGKGMLYGIYDS